jgi:hypothetical protein
MTKALSPKNDYCSALEALEGRLGGAPARGPLRAELAAWRNAFASFDAFSHGSTRTAGIAVQDWNPVSQRAFVDRPTTPAPALIRTVAEAAQVVDAFVIDVHESLHVLLLEPFFTGHVSLARRSTFEELYLSTEGFAFWYCDFVLTPKLRMALPHGELLYSRDSVSSPRFSPEAALHSAGLTDHSTTLGLYVDAFCGRRTELLGHPSIRVDSLARDICRFYFNWRKPVLNLHAYFRETGVVTELFRRFCAVPGLPSTSEADVLARAATDVRGYLETFRMRGIPALRTLGPARLAAVRARRMVQTRAYFGLTLRHVLATGTYFSANRSRPSPAEADELVARLDDYLDLLESTLRGSLVRGDLDAVARDVRKADGWYRRLVRSPLRARALWSSERRYAHDLMRLGLGVRRFGVHDLRRVRTADLQFVGKLLLESLTRAPSRAAASLDAVRQLSTVTAARSERERIARFRAVLTSPAVAPLWAVPLASIDPERNRFREPINYFP